MQYWPCTLNNAGLEKYLTRLHNLPALLVSGGAPEHCLPSVHVSHVGTMMFSVCVRFAGGAAHSAWVCVIIFLGHTASISFADNQTESPFLKITDFQMLFARWCTNPLPHCGVPPLDARGVSPRTPVLRLLASAVFAAMALSQVADSEVRCMNPRSFPSPHSHPKSRISICCSTAFALRFCQHERVVRFRRCKFLAAATLA